MASRTLNILLLFLIVFCISCNQANNEKGGHRSYPEGLNDDQKKLFDEMMDIHDEAMPKQEVIYNLQMKVADSLKKLKSLDDVDSGTINKLEKVMEDLTEAEESMMQWMRENDFKFDSMSSSQITSYLNREIGDIRQIRKKMFASIDSTRKILKKEW